MKSHKAFFWFHPDNPALGWADPWREVINVLSSRARSGMEVGLLLTGRKIGAKDRSGLLLRIKK